MGLPTVEVVGTYATVEELLHEGVEADVVVLDLQLRDSAPFRGSAARTSRATALLTCIMR